MGTVELTEDGKEFVGYQTVADEFALMGLFVVVPMEHTQVAQVAAADVGIGDVGLTLHLLPDAIGDGLRSKALRSILALHAERSAKPEQRDEYISNTIHYSLITIHYSLITIHFLLHHLRVSLDVDAVLGGLAVETHAAEGIDGSRGIVIGTRVATDA